MREKTRITAIGSCRIATPLKAAPAYLPVLNNNDRIYGYTHTAPEALQQVRFLQQDFTPLPDTLPLLMPATDFDTLSASTHEPSDFYIVELSSAKHLHIAGTQVQLNYVTRHFADFFADKPRARDFWRLSDGRQEAEKQAFLEQQNAYQTLPDTDKALLGALTLEMATPDSLAATISEIRDRLPRLLILTHCNATGANGQPLKARAAYIDMVEQAAAKARVPVFNPTASLQAFGQEHALSDPETSLSHYAADFGDFLFAGIFDRHIAPARGVPSGSEAISRAIAHFESRTEIKSIAPHIGSIAFLTGSLGAGGAERQLARLAAEMRRREMVAGTVEVIVSTLDPAKGRDFFLPGLQAAEVPVATIPDLPAVLSPDDLPAPLQPLLRHLPPQTQQALQRLTPHFIAHRPEVAYIWQDGAVLATALAALAANVPRIVISLRGMPPNLRPEMMKDEYFALYRALSRIPGVTFSANTHASADAYAEWLDLPPDSIRVVHNAAEPLDPQGDEADRATWEAFRETTQDADFTFGAVFRFDRNKRPLLWLEWAAAALAAHPASRFVLVGDGAELQAAKTFAREMGIDHRCLFTGKSRNVGFWMARMNALGLSSRLEGLPNVLIEAQLAGLPVISTPAGGAAETFLPNQSGYLLDNTETPSLAPFLGHYLALAQNPAHRKDMSRHARHFARKSFALDRILPETLALLSDAPPRVASRNWRCAHERRAFHRPLELERHAAHADAARGPLPFRR